MKKKVAKASKKKPRSKPKPTADDIEAGDLPAAGRSYGHSNTTVGGIETYRRPVIGGRAPRDRPTFAAGDSLRDSWEPNRNYKP
jgi:hypothetical protein